MYSHVLDVDVWHSVSSDFPRVSPFPLLLMIVVVDNISIPRQPSPRIDGIYFITPDDVSVKALVSDFSKRGQVQHKAVHVFFTSAVEAHQLEMIRGCSRLIERLKTLKEINIEYILYPDNRSFTTCQDLALSNFFGAAAELNEMYRSQITTCARRLATVFATLKENPLIRYRAALPPGDEYPPGLESRLLLSQRIAVDLHEALGELHRAGHIPERETCELIITDRGFDPVAPIIHEWTYEAMIHDLLEEDKNLHGKVFTYHSQMQGGRMENKEHILNEEDALYLDLRHKHFAAASMQITTELDELRSKSRVSSTRGQIANMDLRGIARLVQDLPEYHDRLTQLGAHIELASSVNRLIDTHNLTELGKLEQDLVFGDATSKEIIAFLSTNQMLPVADKVRLLMCYCATHQEKLDRTREGQWRKVARLNDADMTAITNLEYLGIPVCKRQRSGLAGLSFGRRRRRAVRKEREQGEDEQQFSLARFVPLLAEVVEDAHYGRLPQEEYPYVRPPGSPSVSGSGASIGSASESIGGIASSSNTPTKGIASFRTVRTNTSTWAKKVASGNSGSASAALNPGTSTMNERNDRLLQTRGGKIFVFVAGGMTYSELRSAHRLTAKLGRDVFIGGTDVQTPEKFLRQVMSLGSDLENLSTFDGIESATVSSPNSNKRR